MLKNVVSNLWTLPNTLLGFLVGLLLMWCLPTFDSKRTYWEFCCGRGISRWIQRRGTYATTLGSAVLFWLPSASEDEALLEHELVHVRQYNLLGPFFLLIYLSLLPFFGSGKRHPLEKPGYERQDEVRRGGR